MKSGKTLSTITKEEQLDLKVATTLYKEWYTTMDEICDKPKSRKCIKTNPGVCNDLHPVSAHDSHAPTPLPISNGRSFEDRVVSLGSLQIHIMTFSYIVELVNGILIYCIVYSFVVFK